MFALWKPQIPAPGADFRHSNRVNSPSAGAPAACVFPAYAARRPATTAIRCANRGHNVEIAATIAGAPPRPPVPQTACYPEPMHASPPLRWKPVSLPRRAPMEGRTVTLEPLDAQRHAAPLWQAVRGHDELWAWLFDGPYATERELRSDLERKHAAADRVFFAIVPRALGHAAGYASYLRMEPAHGVIEVGNILMSPALQRTTAATEAMYLMARHVFDDLGYRRYEWKCNAENAPSRRAAQRYGFTFEGIFRQHMVVKDRNRDTAWFAMLDHEWPNRKAAFETWLAPQNFDAEGKQLRPLGITTEE